MKGMLRDEATAAPATATEPLAAYAFAASESRGRRYPEPPHRYRGEFQRDRDRVIHSRAFRRLENKTQVFPQSYSDHFRNRLTHTLEVAQISRTVARQLGLNGELTETLALAHDIGHPPYGHSGEQALDRAMRAHGDRFDHNLHALRIVESFEQRYAEFPGLNLTFEVREGIVKHSRDYAPDEAPELVEYDLGLRPPLEAQLIDWTDEISYNSADLDDAFEAHLLTIDQIRASVEIFARMLEQVHDLYPHATDKQRFNEALRRMIDYFVTDLIDTTRAAVAPMASAQEVRRHARRLVSFSPESDRHRLGLKSFLHANLYNHPQLRREKERAERLVEETFAFYMANPARLPHAYQEQTSRLPLHRVVCDYLAGMTDSYIAELNREIQPSRRVAR